MKYGKQIADYEGILAAAARKQSLICPQMTWLGARPHPAAFVMNMTAGRVYQMLKYGLFVYLPEKPFFKKKKAAK